jgi:hypothetical protein
MKTYTKNIDRTFKGQIDWSSGLWIILLDTAYTPNFDTDEFLDDLPSAARVAEVALTGLTFANRELAIAQTLIPSVTGDKPTQAVVYQRKSTNTETTSPLLMHYTQAEVAGMTAYNPSGNNVALNWPDPVLDIPQIT